jgi:hypothetical protein
MEPAKRDTALRLISNNEIVEPVEETDGPLAMLEALGLELDAIQKHAVKGRRIIREILEA